MTHLYLTEYTANTDHCQNCGAEEFEGTTGALLTYLVIEMLDDVVDVVKFHSEMALCPGCAYELSKKESK